MRCLNCDTETLGKFCPECGQKIALGRITFSSTVSNMLSAFANMDRGLLYNLKHLTFFPGKTIIDYISGKRKSVFNPFIALYIWLLLFLVFKSYNGIFESIMISFISVLIGYFLSIFVPTMVVVIFQ